MPQKIIDQYTERADLSAVQKYQLRKKDKENGEIQKLEESVPPQPALEAPEMVEVELEVKGFTPKSPITLIDYKAHILGWHHGVSGQAEDTDGGKQYRAGFEVGRKTRNDYARTLKRLVQ